MQCYWFILHFFARVTVADYAFQSLLYISNHPMTELVDIAVITAELLTEHCVFVLVTRRLLNYNVFVSNHWKNGTISVIDMVWNRSDYIVYLFCIFSYLDHMYRFIDIFFIPVQMQLKRKKIWIWSCFTQCYEKYITLVLSHKKCWPVFGYLPDTYFEALFDLLQ